MKAVFSLIALVVFLFVAKTSVFAVTVSITDFPSTITDQPFTLVASISGASAGTNYLKIDIYKDGTSNYFGETFNGSDWYNGSIYSQYFSINLQSGIPWSGSVQGRIGSPNSTEFDRTGSYKLRLRRYTNGGGYTSAEANGSAVTVSINLPTPTNTPTPSPTPTQAPTNTPTPSPTTTITPTPMPTLRPVTSPAATAIPAAVNPVQQQQVLGQQQTAADNSLFAIPSGTDNKDKNIQLFSSSDKQIISKILIFLGIIFMFLCAIVVLYPKIDEFIKSKKNE